jgi:hypothetical protein
MSIGTLTTLGAARDTGDPKKSDVGRALEGTDQKARITDVLVSSIPTEVVAAYTAAVALVVGFIDPAKQRHFPDQFKTLRWGMFGALVGITAISVYCSFRSKSTARLPVPEVAAAVLSAAIWGLSLPDSPLNPSLHGDNKAIVPALIILGAGTVLVAVSSVLVKKSTAAP